MTLLPHAKTNQRRILTHFLLACACLWPCMAVAADIVLGGAGAAIGTMQALGAEYTKSNPGTRVKVLPSLSTSGGIKALLSGKISIAISGRALSDSERAAGLTETEFARTPLVIAVSVKNSVAHLSLDEITALYAGRTTHWADGTPVRPVLRPDTDSDTQLLKTFSPAVAHAAGAALTREGILVAVTDTDSADALERLPGAFGTASLSTLISEKRALKAVAISGKEPSVKALAENRYPWHKTFYLVTREPVSPETAGFLKFTRTPAAHALLRAAGSLPTGSK